MNRPPLFGRSGTSLVEVLVAISLFGLAGSLSVRVLSDSARSLDEAELGLHALLFLSEVAAAPVPGEVTAVRPLGPGRLVTGADADGSLIVRYDPASAGTGLFSRENAWRLSPP